LEGGCISLRRYIIAAVCVLLLSDVAWAADVLPEELARTAPEAALALERIADGGAELGEVLVGMLEQTLEKGRGWVSSGLRHVGLLTAGVLLLSVAEVLIPGKDSAAEGGVTLVGTLWITALSAGKMEAMMGLGCAVMEKLALVSKFLIPALAASAAAGGAVTSAGIFQSAAVLFSDLLLSAMKGIFLPGVYLYAALVSAAAVLEGPGLDKLAALLKRGISWSLVALLGCYTAFLTLGGATAGAVDKRAVQAAKAVMSTVVPVVGRALSEAAETVLAGAGVLRASLGTFAALAVCGICLVPVLRLGWQYLLYQGAALTVSCVGPKKLGKLLETLSGAFGLVLAMTAASAMLLLISVASVVMVAGV